MTYDVTFQIGGEEQTERVEAPDAATAASRIRNAHQAEDSLFELLLVHLVEEEAGDAATGDAAAAGDATASGAAISAAG